MVETIPFFMNKGTFIVILHRNPRFLEEKYSFVKKKKTSRTFVAVGIVCYMCLSTKLFLLSRYILDKIDSNVIWTLLYHHSTMILRYFSIFKMVIRILF